MLTFLHASGKGNRAARSRQNAWEPWAPQGPKPPSEYKNRPGKSAWPSVFAGNGIRTGDLQLGNPIPAPCAISARPRQSFKRLSRLEQFPEQILAASPAKSDGRLAFSSTITKLLCQVQTAQLTALSPGTRSNSLVLFVTKVTPCETAWAAISRSMEPIGVPAFSRDARISP